MRIAIMVLGRRGYVARGCRKLGVQKTGKPSVRGREGDTIMAALRRDGGGGACALAPQTGPLHLPSGCPADPASAGPSSTW